MSAKRPKAKQHTKVQPPATVKKTRPNRMDVNKDDQRRRVSRNINASGEQIRSFVLNYIVHHSAKRAAMAAGYAESNAASAGCHLLGDPVVQEQIQIHALQATSAKVASAREVLEGLTEISRSNVAVMWDRTVEKVRGKLVIVQRFKDIDEIPVELQRCIASIKVIKQNLTTGDGISDQILEVKFWNKLQAYDLLGKHYGAFRTIIEHQVTVQQLDKMTDVEFLDTQKQAIEKYERHLAAKARLEKAIGTITPEGEDA